MDWKPLRGREVLRGAESMVLEPTIQMEKVIYNLCRPVGKFVW